MAELGDTRYSAFNYLVNWDDGSEAAVMGGFAQVSGLNAEMTIAEYRGATENYSALNKTGDVTLKRGVIGAANIYAWLEQVCAGDVNAKRNVEIKLTSETPGRAAVMTWMLLGARPIKWTGPILTARGGSDVAIEELVLTVEHIEQS